MTRFTKIVGTISPFHSKENKHRLLAPTVTAEVRQQADDHWERSQAKDKSRDDAKAGEREAYERDDLKPNYGRASESKTIREHMTIHFISKLSEGDPVQFRARIHHLRPMGPKLIFIIFRQRMATVQGLMTEEPGIMSQNMIRWAKHLHDETIVLVTGVVQTPKGGQQEVKSTTVRDIEIRIHTMFVVAEPTAVLPFHVGDASRPKKTCDEGNSHFTRVGEHTRLQRRVLELRTPTSQAIFRIHAGICRLFRTFLDSREFTEIQSSKLQESATETGASVFKVDYFRRMAFLAQSPQLAKQMCIAADMEKVYEIGPVFRAENSNTHRHLTEFIGLDLEMTFDSHYSEIIDLLDVMLLDIFRSLRSEFLDEIEIIKKQYPHYDIVFLDKTLRLTFQEGIKLLRDSGWKKEGGKELGDFDDLNTKGEQRLGQIIKEKYNTDYYILDKFPLNLRPFYTMPDPKNKKLSNSCDFFLRGEEILSGGQRIHEPLDLEERMKESGIDPASMNDYLDGFRWGCPPHGGGGIGLERLIMLFLDIHNIRWTSLFPRDPRSFTKSAQEAAEAAAAIAQSAVLHGPKARTLRKRSVGHIPPLADLIAKYGDATNTSWVDPAWTVWRHTVTGAAVGYMPSEGFAVGFGSPLCERQQISQVIHAYLIHIQEKKLKPVWCCVDHETERYLAKDLGWSGVIAVAEERLNPTEVSVEGDKNTRRKIHRAEREGVKIKEIIGSPNDSFRKIIEQRLQEWAENRRGIQIHLTGLRPFDDEAHRRYFYATDKEGKICCLVVLAQLASVRGFQIKWSLEFPGAPLGAIEYILSNVIRRLGDAGIKSATFGAGATKYLEPVDNIGGIRIKVLEKSYNGLSHTFSLMNKGDFRSKFGVQQDPLYICYPKHGLGMKGVNAIMNALKRSK